MDSSEESPLLTPPVAAVSSGTVSSQKARTKPFQTLVISVLLLYVIFLDLGYELIVPAQTRVFENIYCRLYYEKHDPSLIGKDGVDEKWCKVSPVQGEVAMLKGWQMTLDSIGMLIFSVPWVSAADSYGRRPVILLLTLALFVKYAYVQLICYLGGAVSLRLTWLSTFHTVCGGSILVANALIYTIISDVFPQAKRIALFFQILAANITTQFLGSLLSAALMIRTPWIPMVLGLAIELISVFIIFFIPETLNYGIPALQECSPPLVSTAASSQQQSSRWQDLLHHTRDSTSFLLSDIRILLVVSAFITHTLVLNRDVLLQYISARYGVSLAHATVLVSVRSGVVFILCVIILPAVNHLCRSRLGPNRADLLLSRISVAFTAISFLGLGLASSLPLLIPALLVNSLGWGLFPFLRSLCISFVDTHNVARLNSFISIFDTMGSMVGSPALATLFTMGIELGEPWIGLPFYVCAAVFAILALGIIGLRP